jgi:hypothetical protein
VIMMGSERPRTTRGMSPHRHLCHFTHSRSHTDQPAPHPLPRLSPPPPTPRSDGAVNH